MPLFIPKSHAALVRSGAILARSCSAGAAPKNGLLTCSSVTAFDRAWSRDGAKSRSAHSGTVMRSRVTPAIVLGLCSCHGCSWLSFLRTMPAPPSALDLVGCALSQTRSSTQLSKGGKTKGTRSRGCPWAYCGARECSDSIFRCPTISSPFSLSYRAFGSRLVS